MSPANRRRRPAPGAGTPPRADRSSRLTVEELADRCVPAVVSEVPLGTALPAPQGITAGPDGSLWYTDPGANKVGRIDTAGAVTEYTLPTPASDPRGITAGPDGALWFALFGTDRIGRIDPATGAVTEFQLTLNAGPSEITAGPDGALWFTESAADMIGRITPAGVVTEFAVPGAGSTPFGITSGPDGRLWFTQFGSDEIGAITPAGVVSEFAAGAAGQPTGITTGPDGNLWYGSNLPNFVGRIRPDGTNQTSFTGFGDAATAVQDVAAGPDGAVWATGGAGDRVIRFAADGTPTEFTTGFTPGGTPTGITPGPDGNLWFTEPNTPAVGRITPAGAVTEFILRASGGPADLTAGPDGNLWFTESDADKIGRLAPGTSALTEFYLPNTGSDPRGITAGPDGNLWFAEFGGDRIGRITPAGVITEFTDGLTTGAGPRDITLGPDGNLWFTEAAADQIGRITPTGVVTEFAVPGLGSTPLEITAGPDGRLWFTQFGSDEIGAITADGTVTEFAVPGAGSGPTGIAAGPDGNLWFTENTSSEIGRITPTGVVTEFATATPAAGPTGIAAGPDGALWFTEATANQVGRITTAGVVTELAAGITAAAGLSGITLTPDGSLWFAESTANQLGRVVLSADLTVTKTNGVTSAVPGMTVTYTIVVTNPAGGDPVTGARVTDPFTGLTGVTWTAVFAGGATGTAGGSGAIDQLVDLPAGGSVTYTATGTIDPAATGTLTNTASVATGVPDPTPDNNSATDADALTPTADLSVVKTNGVTTVTRGQATTYTIVVTNTGPSRVPAAAVADAFTGLTGVTWTAVFTGGATGTAAGSGPINETVALPPGGTVVYVATGTVNPAATGGSFTNTASVTAAATDPTPGNNSATDTDTLTPNQAPTISAIPDPAAVTAGTAVGPIAFTVGDAEAGAGPLTVTAASSNTTLVPNANIVLGGTGATRTVTVTPAAGQTGTATITLTVADAVGGTATETFTVTFTAAPRAGLVGVPQFAAGADRGSGSVIFYNADKSVRFTTDPFGTFSGGVRTAAGDFNGDGVADLVVGTGPGRATQVRVLDGKTQAQIFSVDPFEASFTGGVYVAAGDVTGDGVAELIISPDEGGGPRVRIFNGVGFGQLADFFGIADPNFRGGARVAVGDVNGDGTGDLVVAAGFLGGPRVATFDGKTLGGTPQVLFNDFFAFEQTLRNGVFIAAGDLDGDGKAEVIAGGGPGGGPRVTAFSAKDLISSGGATLTQVANFFGGDPANRGGIRLAVKDLDGDPRADLVVGSGAGAGSRVTGYLGTNIAPAGTPPAVVDFDAFPGFTGGVFVG